jgi:membrane fusion protein (multidrug efflux system)
MQIGLVALMATGGAGCGKKDKGPGGPPPGSATRVRAENAQVGPLEESIALVASVSANESVEVKSEVDGLIESISFQEGQPVRKGEPLVTLDQSKLAAAVAQNEANYRLALLTRERAETMLKNNTISQQEYDQATATFQVNEANLELARQQLKDTRITAPFEGLAGSRMVSPGQVISRNTTITTLVDLTPVKVEFRVPERFLGQLKTGQAILFRVPAYPGETFRGEVYFIDPQVDLDTRTVLVKATQENADGRLRPGMFGNLDLVLLVREASITVPESAVLRNGDAAFLYTLDAESKAQMNPVEIGARRPGRVEILRGLQGGELVIYEGTQKIGPGSLVTNMVAAAVATP